MAHAISYIDLLPLNIVSLISENLENDLIAHVTFGKLRPHIWAHCYEDATIDFWEPVLRASGLGAMPDEEIDGEAWGKLAVHCVEHAEHCWVSGCGIEQLRSNEWRMRDAIEASMDGSLDVMSTVDPGNLKETDPRVFETDAAVWQSIAFKRSRDRTHSIETWRSAAFVRLNDSNELAWYGDRLEHHPVIWRSFAAYPPVSRMTMTGGPIIEAANPFGVVVGDLLGEIMKTRKIADTRLYPELLSELVERAQFLRSDPNVPIIPNTWSQHDVARALIDYRDWFMIVRCIDIEFIELHEKALWFDWGWDTQHLPWNYDAFDAATSY